MIKHMNHLARTLLGCLMLLCTTMVYAQHAQFKGQVIDQEGNPLVGEPSTRHIGNWQKDESLRQMVW